jgi:DNA-binding MarR family transcriptional regulator
MPARRSASEHNGASRKRAANSRTPASGASKTAAVISVLQKFRELFRASQQHFQRIESNCGVSGAQLWAMSELAARPAQKISELAAAMSIHLSTASNLLGKLEEKGLVRRERCAEDQRVVRVYLTRQGARTLKAAPKPAEGVIPDALARMTATALGRLDRDLEELLKHAAVRDRRAAMKHLAEP